MGQLSSEGRQDGGLGGAHRWRLIEVPDALIPLVCVVRVIQLILRVPRPICTSQPKGFEPELGTAAI